MLSIPATTKDTHLTLCSLCGFCVEDVNMVVFAVSDHKAILSPDPKPSHTDSLQPFLVFISVKFLLPQTHF